LKDLYNRQSVNKVRIFGTNKLTKLNFVPKRNFKIQSDTPYYID